MAEGEHPVPLRLLVLEDNVSHARFVRSVLEAMARPVEIHQAGRLSSATERLRAESFDFVLADLHLPDAQGAAIVAQLVEVAPLVPVIVVSAVDDPTMAQAALAAGAHDYLAKDALTPDLLVHVLLRARQRSAGHSPGGSGVLLDPATGVFNRNGLRLATARTIAFARRKGHPVTVLHLHVEGTPSEFIELTKLVAGSIRDADFLGRVGADRIAIVMPDDRSDPPAFLARLRQRVAESAQAGVAFAVTTRRFDPNDPVTAAELLLVADEAQPTATKPLKRALVVTDEPALVEEIRSCLGSGWSVLEAKGAGPAARLASLEEPDVAIVDLQLDGGMAVARSIADQPEVHGLAIIAILPAGDTPDTATRRTAGVVSAVGRDRVRADLAHAAERATRR